jgi:hypothetical protein
MKRAVALFPINNQRHPCRGQACRGGHTVISVDGDVTARPCHFVRTPIANLYSPDSEGSGAAPHAVPQ